MRMRAELVNEMNTFCHLEAGFQLPTMQLYLSMLLLLINTIIKTKVTVQ